MSTMTTMNKMMRERKTFSLDVFVVCVCECVSERACVRERPIIASQDESLIQC